MEFPSAVDAVRCAIAVQHGMAARNAGITSERRIEFRIGINVGDVIAQDGDLLGDGVNIAARLDGLSEPGGIVLSANAYEHIDGKVETTFIDDGEQEVKNIARPVQVWRWSPGQQAPAKNTAATLDEPLPLPSLIISFVTVPYTISIMWKKNFLMALTMNSDTILCGQEVWINSINNQTSQSSGTTKIES
jgi:adenylate cyclase